MRTQYYFQRLPGGLCAWNVHRLIELSRTLAPERVPLSAIRELDEPHWAHERTEQLTCREIAGHARLILDCDLAHPVILSSGGRVMDGMHRVCKALLEGPDPAGHRGSTLLRRRRGKPPRTKPATPPGQM
jgi:hypothetical protein